MKIHRQAESLGKQSNYTGMRGALCAIGIVGLGLFPPAGFAIPANPRAIDKTELSVLPTLFPRQTVLGEHAFRVDLPQCGTCLFVPIQDLQGRPEISLHLVKEGQITYTLAQSEADRTWAAWEVLAVAFTDLDADGDDDIMLLAEYMTGIGPQGAVPFPAMSIYYSRKRGFELDPALSQTLTDRRVETIGEAIEFIRNDLRQLP
ncbi:hypothetical protein [Synechococcus sp. PCC 7336]|uniref:hypothetical protein n=1 Tax=Synechococcus sp. PCC 7336 TaxID=195250 RepID=UPI000375FF10|nr:hypothetical protein [Synechococcus sp. PCC 7336]